MRSALSGTAVSRELVGRRQRARLEAAMTTAVGRHGFASVTVRELVTLAGVSKSTFYEHFEDKVCCFLVTFDRIMAEIGREVAEACEGPGAPRERLVRALGRVAAFAGERPEAISLVAVDSLTLGGAAAGRREKALEPFAATARRTLGETGATVPDLTTRTAIGGIAGVVHRRLRSEESDRLEDLIEPLADWALDLAHPENLAAQQAAAAAERPATGRPPEPADLPDWEEPPDSPRSRSSLSQRERIVRAAVRVVVERGYEALSIPAISSTAGTSNQTFYENFASKRDAFLAGYESVSGEAIKRTSAVLAEVESGPEAVGLALRALCEFIAGNELYARLAFVELPAAGAPGLDRADETMDLFVSFLERSREKRADEEPLPRESLEATAAGIWFAIQGEIVRGRRQALPERAGELTRLALAPLAPDGGQRRATLRAL